MSHHQLTQTNRIEIAILFRTGMSYRAIGKQIGFHHSTVSRELRRHTWHNPSGYNAIKARLQLKRTRLVANQHCRKLPTNGYLVTVITRKLQSNWSPEQIAGWLRDSGAHFRVCAQTIYDWLYTHARNLLRHLHCRKGKYRRTRQSTLRKAFRQVQKEQRHISNRPAHILKRSRYGHWEGDTIRGKAHSGYIATFVERKSGYLLAMKLERATAASFAAAVSQCFAIIVPSRRKTLTLDNGSEMDDYEAVEHSTDIKVYFATPYHSWERGTNENTNGLLRFYFPKQMRFTNLTQTQLDAAVHEINTRPRKRLGYKTPAQVLKANGAFRIGV